MERTSPVHIPLVGSDLCATVDAEDADVVRQFDWFAVYHDGATYAVTFVPDDDGGEHALYMHDLIAARHGRVD